MFGQRKRGQDVAVSVENVLGDGPGIDRTFQDTTDLKQRLQIVFSFLKRGHLLPLFLFIFVFSNKLYNFYNDTM